MATTTASQTDAAFVDHLNVPALAFAGAIMAAAVMLLLGILANVGLYEGAAAMMMEWHMFFSLTFSGIITGMVEAAIITFVVLYVFSWIYNTIAARSTVSE
ncbi:hypothetical protein [Natrononativus amylolyticus]|uniref:hypothetical protein n=1 Tax=Natrononativus amylolyticus TaxID=2963434 RepID=UPI0020CBE36B|nr:hypothetical protein [Natrononativus amylolyticus]